MFDRKRNRLAERLTREADQLKHENVKLRREVDVRDLEIKRLYEVVERDRARVLAETASHVKRQAKATLGEVPL